MLSNSGLFSIQHHLLLKQEATNSGRIAARNSCRSALRLAVVANETKGSYDQPRLFGQSRQRIFYPLNKLEFNLRSDSLKVGFLVGGNP
jgi:hypothetical protein